MIPSIHLIISWSALKKMVMLFKTPISLIVALSRCFTRIFRPILMKLPSAHAPHDSTTLVCLSVFLFMYHLCIDIYLVKTKKKVCFIKKYFNSYLNLDLQGKKHDFPGPNSPGMIIGFTIIIEVDLDGIVTVKC